MINWIAEQPDLLCGQQHEATNLNFRTISIVENQALHVAVYCSMLPQYDLLSTGSSSQ